MSKNLPSLLTNCHSLAALIYSIFFPVFVILVCVCCVCMYPVFQVSWRLSCWAATAEVCWPHQQMERERDCHTLSPGEKEGKSQV